MSEQDFCPHRNLFCNVYALFTPKKNGRNITVSVIKGFERYFQLPFRPNLWYTPEIVCDYCYRCLTNIVSEKKDELHKNKYVRPTIWLSVDKHEADDCYLSKKEYLGFHYNQREAKKYPELDSVVVPRKRSNSRLYSPMELDLMQQEQEQEQVEMDYDDAATVSFSAPGPPTSEYVPTECQLGEPHLITQADFNDLVRESNMSQSSAEIVGSRLSEWNLR